MPAARTAELLERLSEGVAQLTDSQRWRDWLVAQGRFREYSFNNSLLIMLQRPDATRVAGFHAWRKMDRVVRRGEKGIWILAPLTYRVDGASAIAHGAPEETRTTVLRGFKAVPVYDLAQTEGRELPAVVSRLLGEDPEGTFAGLTRAAEALDFTVEESDQLPGSVNGDCSHALRRIRVRNDNSPRQRTKTLAHELAHAILHAEFDLRSLAELEAESVAFMVCRHLGIASDDYSFGYVASWAGGGEAATQAIRASAGRIQRAVEEILSVVAPTTPPPDGGDR